MFAVLDDFRNDSLNDESCMSDCDVSFLSCSTDNESRFSDNKSFKFSIQQEQSPTGKEEKSYVDAQLNQAVRALLEQEAELEILLDNFDQLSSSHEIISLELEQEREMSRMMCNEMETKNYDLKIIQEDAEESKKEIDILKEKLKNIEKLRKKVNDVNRSNVKTIKKLQLRVHQKNEMIREKNDLIRNLRKIIRENEKSEKIKYQDERNKDIMNFQMNEIVNVIFEQEGTQIVLEDKLSTLAEENEALKRELEKKNKKCFNVEAENNALKKQVKDLQITNKNVRLKLKELNVMQKVLNIEYADYTTHNAIL